MRDSLFSLFRFFALAVFGTVAFGQSTFEVASVKRSERCSLSNHIDPERISLVGDPLKVILMEAYSVKMDQIVGPSWLDSDCFDIIAKVPRGSTKQQIGDMYRSLLAERFKLVAHKEPRDRIGYALVVDNNGIKIKQSEPAANAVRATAGHTTFGSTADSASIKGAMTMAALARFISNRLGAPVEDLTRMQGTYDVDLAWRTDPTLDKSGPVRLCQSFGS